MSRVDLAPASVVEHSFGAGPPFTVGVEEEFMLLDTETLDLVHGVEAVLAKAVPADEFAPELFESLLETHTPVCAGVAEARDELLRVRRRVGDSVAAQGLRFGAAGTHPFSLFESQRVTARDRYRGIIEELQYVARRELIFGLHVHVAVPDPATAIAVVRGISLHLGELLALSASSPFWRGAPTGLTSMRQHIFSGFPRSGPPPPFRDYEEYAALVGVLQATGCIEDYTRIWWDVRPHPRLGTVETRIMDAVARLDDVVALAALVQCLVRHYADRHAAGDEPALPHPALVAENKWRAIRWGLAAELVDLDAESPRRVPATRLVGRLLRRLAGVADELGCRAELDGVGRILEQGNGAARQLLVFSANGDPIEVARDIADQTAAL